VAKPAAVGRVAEAARKAVLVVEEAEALAAKVREAQEEEGMVELAAEALVEAAGWGVRVVAAPAVAPAAAAAMAVVQAVSVAWAVAMVGTEVTAAVAATAAAMAAAMVAPGTPKDGELRERPRAKWRTVHVMWAL
jgi:hypothetical protein